MPITCENGKEARYRFGKRKLSGGKRARFAFCGRKAVEVSIFKKGKKIKTKKLKGWFGDSIGHSNARSGLRKAQNWLDKYGEFEAYNQFGGRTIEAGVNRMKQFYKEHPEAPL